MAKNTGVLDLDISQITDPNDPAPEGKYHLTVVKSEISKNEETGSIGVNVGYRIATPGEHQGKMFSEYVNCVKKDQTENKLGTWRIKTLMGYKGLTKGKFFENVPHIVGAEFDADLEIEPGGDFPDKNKIKKFYQ